MEYVINQSGNRVVLDLLANATKSLVGLAVNNCRIISIPYSELYAMVLSVYGVKGEWVFCREAFKYRTTPLSDAEDDSVIVLESVEVEGFRDTIASDYTILEALKLYQSSDIFSCYSLSYRFKNGKIQHGGRGETFLWQHGTYWPEKPYEITDDARSNFNAWLNEHRDLFHSGHHNAKFRQMKQLYLSSYLTDDANLSFVMLSVVLEMLFGGNNELSYRISRGAGMFLSTDREEARSLFARMKKLYDMRSKYVHEGKRVKDEQLFELREIVRRVIVLMFERGMHKPDFDFKKFSDELTYDGYPQS